MSTTRMSELRDFRTQLLAYSRRVARAALGAAPIPAMTEPDVHLDQGPDSLPTDTEELSGLGATGCFGGLFVTFWRGSDLRGCVGSFAPIRVGQVAASVAEVTQASLRDSRFTRNPITTEELDELTIEISLLSDPTPTDDPLSLVPGEHGIIVRQGMRSGCFLPKVATDRGWSAEEFLSTCCTMKAGLPADAWRSPQTQVLIFRAEVFSDAA